MGPAVRERITVVPTPLKMLEDLGLTETLVDSGPLRAPLRPNFPREFAFFRICIQDLLRMGLTGPVRYDPVMPGPRRPDRVGMRDSLRAEWAWGAVTVARSAKKMTEAVTASSPCRQAGRG